MGKIIKKFMKILIYTFSKPKYFPSYKIMENWMISNTFKYARLMKKDNLNLIVKLDFCRQPLDHPRYAVDGSCLNTYDPNQKYLKSEIVYDIRYIPYYNKDHLKDLIIHECCHIGKDFNAPSHGEEFLDLFEKWSSKRISNLSQYDYNDR